MKLSFNYGQEVVVLPLRPMLERAKKATKGDLCLLFVLAGDSRLRADYRAEADRAAAQAGVSRAELDRALSFWQGAGVIDVDDSAEGDEREPIPAPVELAPQKKLARENTLPHCTTDQLVSVLESRAEAKSLVDAAQQTFGKLFSPMEVNIVLGMLDYLSLEDEYILILLAWCAGKDKKSMRYAEKMAISLWDEGIRDAETLNRYLLRREETEQLTGEIRRLFGADSRSLTAKEKAALTRWIDDYHCDAEMVRRAYEVTVNATAKPSIPYADSVLRRWHEEGLTTLAQIDDDIARRAKSRDGDAQSSFDTDEFFENAVRRSYS